MHALIPLGASLHTTFSSSSSKSKSWTFCIFILSSLLLVNLGTTFLHLHFLLFTTWMPSRGEYHRIHEAEWSSGLSGVTTPSCLTEPKDPKPMTLHPSLLPNFLAPHFEAVTCGSSILKDLGSSPAHHSKLTIFSHHWEVVCWPEGLSTWTLNQFPKEHKKWALGRIMSQARWHHCKHLPGLRSTRLRCIFKNHDGKFNAFENS